ncbi:serine/threonine-protein kinase [Pseudoxanthomonas spadix]|uniref:serine/threonine-protein kinase n=1 Tax=Pseudoxanthomonas spadix TaxID=415229 RepID=UPI000EFFD765|nr:serine/threonine-protein kinase [Pseudoxanthomonas spadix]MBP3974647.1 serine/threonine protein kinase [Pseudoxanthomonas spadix]RMW92960.1 serine/threonine protein kinase [Pseudoxanthomonas spadix]
MDAAQWQRLSPMLDLLLDMNPQQRTYQLQLIALEDAGLAEEIVGLLALEAAAEGAWPPPLHEAPAALCEGARLGPYRLEWLLGEGGMGMVWAAKRAGSGYQRRVALKLLHAGIADHRLRVRFSRERDILARLEHPHIARLLDAGVGEQGQPYLALEYVEGISITDYCQQHALAIEARLVLFRQVCQAVSHAHANLIVHRDLKPSNILVTASGETRLLDFGIAKLLDAPDGSGARTELRAFTLHYAAPEQVRGEPVTTRTDVYSLGVVLFELLAGTKPYRLQGDNVLAWEQAIIDAEPMRPSQALLQGAPDRAAQPDLRRQARRLRGDLDRIVLKALAKKPEHRYPSVEALSADLRRYLEGMPVQAQRQSVGYRLGKYALRHRWWLLAGSMMSLVLLGAAAISLRQAREAVHEAQRAQAMQDFVIGLFDNAGAAPRGDAFDSRKLLDAGVARGARELANQPLAHAELLGVVARLRIGLGDYAQALALLERADGLLNGRGDVSAQLRLQIAAQHGRALRMLDRGQACASQLAPLEPLTRTLIGHEAETAEFLSQYGRCLRQQGDLVPAHSLFQRALARRQALGDDAGVAENMLDLALLDTDRGREQDALNGYRAALDYLYRHVGHEHPLAVEILRARGAAQRAGGDTINAQAGFRQALRVSEQIHGSDHPLTLGLRRQLVALQVDLGQYALAAEQMESLLARTRQVMGERHRETGLAWNTTGVIAWERGELATAQRDIARAVAIWRQPEGARQLAGGLANYGRVLHAAGHDSQALAALQEARALRVANFGASHPLVGDTDRMIGEVIADQGDARGAQPWFETAVALTRRGYPADHPRRLFAELSLARNRGRLGQPDAALAMLDRLARHGGDGSEAAKLRWRARAYAAETRCTASPSQGTLQQLDALLAQLATVQPDGGVIPREVRAIRERCAERLLAAPAARRPLKTAARPAAAPSSTRRG